MLSIYSEATKLCGYNKLGHAERTGTTPTPKHPWQPKLHSMF
jgi:hypothetical protein